MTTIATFDRIEDAQALHAVLMTEGIPSKLLRQVHTSPLEQPEEFRISVSNEHAEQAVEILRIYREPQFDEINEANRTKHDFSRYIKFWCIAVPTIFILVMIWTSSYSLTGIGISLLCAGIISSLLTAIIGGLDL